MPQRARNLAGFTLIEQLIALLLGSVMIAALYGFCRAQIHQALVQETRTATLEDARGALDIMIGDLKNAGVWSGGSAPAEIGGADDPDSDADLVCNRIYAASEAKIHIQMDLNGNGSCADTNPQENIRYELTGPTTTCGGSRIIRRNGDCLVANVTTPVPGKLFRYFDASGAELGSAPPLSAIKRVRIAFAVRAKYPKTSANDYVASELSTSLELRN
jgi:prepilin-type N-terminal cleavage/methylation domain-containing protein